MISWTRRGIARVRGGIFLYADVRDEIKSISQDDITKRDVDDFGDNLSQCFSL